MKLKGKKAIITGSSRSIGKAIALGPSQREAKVIMCAINGVQLQDPAKQIEFLTRSKVFPVKADLTIEEHIKRLTDETVKHLRAR